VRGGEEKEETHARRNQSKKERSHGSVFPRRQSCFQTASTSTPQHNSCMRVLITAAVPHRLPAARVGLGENSERTGGWEDGAVTMPPLMAAQRRAQPSPLMCRSALAITPPPDRLARDHPLPSLTPTGQSGARRQNVPLHCSHGRNRPPSHVCHRRLGRLWQVVVRAARGSGHLLGKARRHKLILRVDTQ